MIIKNYLLTAPLTNDDLINLIVGFIWENLFILLAQFFGLGLILRIVKLFIDGGRMNGFNGSGSRCLASFSGSVCGDIWLWGDSIRFLVSAERITGEQAVARMRVILGSPQDFVSDHFGAMAIACAVGIAIRMRG